jgi:hypothetical protein
VRRGPCGLMTRQSTLRAEGIPRERARPHARGPLACHPRAYGGADGGSEHAVLGVVRSAVLHGAAQRFVSSARSALIPDVVSAGQVATASAIGSVTYQTGQIVGFVTGAAVVATVGSYRPLGIDTLSFGISALIIMTALRARPAPQRATGERPTM